MRSSIIGFCVICLVLEAVAQFPPIPNSIRSRVLRNTAPAAVEPCLVDETPKWKCQDCEIIQFCGGRKEPDFALPCKAHNANKPYCNANSTSTAITEKCVSDPNVCGGHAPDFTCPGEGIYPSLTDCRSYYTCDEKKSAIKYMCLFNTVYNHAQKFCKFGTVCHDVVSECANQYKMIPYKPSPNLHVVCIPGKPPLLRECRENSVYNSSISDCEFQCPTDGIFADPVDTNNTQFYRCFNDGKTLRKDLEKCPKDFIFSKEKKYCVTVPVISLNPTPSNESTPISTPTPSVSSTEPSPIVSSSTTATT